mgnify:FL=1
MKKIFLCLLVAVFVLTGMSSCDALKKTDKTTDARFFEAVNIDSENGTCAIKLNNDNLTDLPSEITLPTELDGKKVIAVANNGFRGTERLKKVFVPKGYLEIGTDAFSGCSNLTLVELAENLKVSEESADRSAEENAGMIIGHSAFANCVALATVEFGGNVKEIGEYAFKNTRITRAELTAVTKIGDHAFEDCKALTSVYISSAMQPSGIGQDIFSGCSSGLKFEIHETAKANGVTEETAS